MQGPETYRVNYAGQSLFQIGFTYQPHLQILFGTRAIDISIRARIIMVSASVLLLVEIEKLIIRNFVEKRKRISG
jgi:hypothetical protein